ncbi:MAG: molybdenum cofactor guanylyltransferase [Leptospira sp.]|nr:molybdenum cofactor guanylyltransferase [Leptospira sp.]
MNPINTKVYFLLLVGGKSLRMGEDKSFVLLNKKSNFISLLLKRIRIFKIPIFISLRSEQWKKYSSFIPGDTLILDSAVNVEGPLKGIISAFHYFKNKKDLPDYFFVLPIDLPLIRLKTIARLLVELNLIHEKCSGLFYQSSFGIEPLAGIYSTEVLNEWDKEISNSKNQNYSLFQKIKKINPHPKFLNLPLSEEIFFKNINTKEDLTDLKNKL